MSLYYCGVIGLIITGLLNWVTEYYTGTNYRPVQSIAQSSTTGHGTNVIQGLAISLEATALPALIIVAGILITNSIAGLFGIGGGLISVPVLYYVFGAAGFNDNYLMHIAVGTSFSIIVPTSIVSVITHRKHKSVDSSIIKSYGIFVIIGVLVGTVFAALMQTKSLVLFFSLVVVLLLLF